MFPLLLLSLMVCTSSLLEATVRIFSFQIKKYKNVRDGNKELALVIDDLESVQPWKLRGMKINGTAEVVEHNGMFGPGKYLKITPSVSWSWGIKGLQQPKEGEFFVKTVHRQA
jgi:pyridoxamine 5'-phosphate oxidase family protein